VKTLRSFLFVLWMYGGMVIIGTLFLPSLILPGPLVRAAPWLWARQVRWGLRWIAGARTELRGLRHFSGEPVLYAGKHQAMLDVLVPFMIPGLSPVVVLKKELLWYPIFGWYALRIGCIPIDREASAKALKSMVAASKAQIAKGRTIVIFPEGTRTAPGARPDYKPGVAALYRALGVACVPVATNAGLCWPAHGLTRQPGLIVYEALDPIAPGHDRRGFAKALQSAIETRSGELLAEGRAAQGRTNPEKEHVTR
jgi:1-acyl-sn-glycerol-3-phosphate acyltransferase